MGGILVDLVRLTIFILFLPLIIIFIGPLLMLAVLRGRQWMGPLTLDSTGYNLVGRVGIFMLGLAIWLLVWSGLVWLAFEAASPPAVIVQTPLPAPPATEPAVEPTATLTSTPIATAPTSTPTPTPVPPTPTPTPTLGPIIPSNVNTLTPTPVSPTPTPTPLFNETLATNTPLPTSNVVEVSPTVAATLTVADRQAVVATIEEGNLLLQNAISLANEDNIKKLEVIWQGRALTRVADFATGLYGRYAKPFTASFDFVVPPSISAQNSAGEVVITSREKWSYSGPSKTDEESFEFTYTVRLADEGWVITKYSYRNLPLPTPTTIPRDDFAAATPQN
jgi:hypothetical protein